MAATVTLPAGQETYQALGSLKGIIFDVTLATNDYVTGGIDFSSVLPAGTLIGVEVLDATGAGAVVHIPRPDVATKKLLLVSGAAGANTQCPNATSTAITVRLLALVA